MLQPAPGSGAPDLALSATIRVLVVDDEPLVRSGISAILGSAPDLEVVAAVDGVGAVEALSRHAVDVVLLDIRMPVVDGMSVLASVDRLSRRPAVAMLTTFHADDQVAAALLQGADGYLLKGHRSRPADPARAGPGARFLGAVIGGDGNGRGGVPAFAPQYGDQGPAGPVDSPRARGPRPAGPGAPNAEIAQWLFVSVPTIKEHVGAILGKLGVGNRVQAAVFAVRAGLVEES